VLSGSEVGVIAAHWQLGWEGTQHFQHLLKAGGLGISQVSQQVPLLNTGTAIRDYEEGDNPLSQTRVYWRGLFLHLGKQSTDSEVRETA